MRYSVANGRSSDLWQRVLYVALGVVCVILCYFVGAYWIGPWLHQLQGTQSESTPLTSPTPIATNTAPSSSAPAPFSPVTPKLAGVQIRERDPSTLSDTVRVIPSGEAAPPEEHAQTEEPQPSTTLEEQPPAPPPPTNLWAPQPAPSRPTNVQTAPQGGIQVPEPLSGDTVGTPSGVDVLYRVRLPEIFDHREQADAALRSVTDRGLPAAIVTDTVGGRKVFRVQLGVYRNKSSAEKLADQARRAGVSAEVAAPSP